MVVGSVSGVVASNQPAMSGSIVGLLRCSLTSGSSLGFSDSLGGRGRHPRYTAANDGVTSPTSAPTDAARRANSVSPATCRAPREKSSVRK